MTRTMGDATHDAAHTLAQIPGLALVGGYVTGSPSVQWTPADWDLYPGLPHITIDQGFTGSPVEWAVVRDVETGAWTPAAAVNRNGWTPARPTIYCNRSTLPTVLGDGWRGDLWLAIPGWLPGQPLPPAPGCTIVAVQNQLDVNSSYDMSLVLDDTWPIGGEVLKAWKTGTVHIIYSPAGQMQITGVGQDDCIYVADIHPDFTASVPRQVTAPLTFV